MSIAQVLHLEVLGFLSVLAAVVGFQLLTGRINLMGLLQQKDGTGQTSPERIQLLLATIAAAASYMSEAARTPSGNLPDISNNWLYLMGGSSSVYVLRKMWVTFSGKNNSGGKS
jgi:hypothetical protein